MLGSYFYNPTPGIFQVRKICAEIHQKNIHQKGRKKYIIYIYIYIEREREKIQVFPTVDGSEILHQLRER